MRRALTMSAAAVLSIPMCLPAQGCTADNAGLKLQPGFCATVFADDIRGARQLVVAPNGDVLVSATGGRGGASAGGVYVLREQNHSGKADVVQQLISGFASNHVGLFDGYLYVEQHPARGRGAPAGASQGIAIVRYAYKPGDLKLSGPGDTIVAGLPMMGHSTRNFVFSKDGEMFVNVGSGTNSCQVADRQKASPGVNPCTELETRAGIWKFDARKKNQTQATGVHFARGIRNAVGIAISPLDGKLWVTQHGRDMLGGQGANWNFDEKYNAANPAEELLQVNQGDDFGWPYCYYSVDERRLVLAPEYGGDGKKVEQCASKKEPVAIFPGHWAPNALLFYTGPAFPAKYKSGAFIAFHGSWNRQPPGGYNVVFQPLAGEKSAGAYEVFADGFSTTTTGSTGNHRPSGLAQTADGALLVSDDASGRIYKITYSGK